MKIKTSNMDLYENGTPNPTADTKYGELKNIKDSFFVTTSVKKCVYIYIYIYLFIVYTSRAKRAPVGALLPCPFRLRQGAFPLGSLRSLSVVSSRALAVNKSSLWGTPQGGFRVYEGM